MEASCSLGKVVVCGVQALVVAGVVVVYDSSQTDGLMKR